MDNTTGMLQEWLAAVGSDYATVRWRPEEEARWLTEGKGADGEQPFPRAQPQSMPCLFPAEKERPLSQESISPFPISGPTQMNRVPSTGPKKDISF